MGDQNSLLLLPSPGFSHCLAQPLVKNIIRTVRWVCVWMHVSQILLMQVSQSCVPLHWGQSSQPCKDEEHRAKRTGFGCSLKRILYFIYWRIFHQLSNFHDKNLFLIFSPNIWNANTHQADARVPCPLLFLLWVPSHFTIGCLQDLN